MEPATSTVTPAKAIMEKVVLEAQSPLLKKLFGVVSEPRTRAELGSFVEMCREIFYPDSSGGVVVVSNGSVLAQCSSSSAFSRSSGAFKVCLKIYRNELRKCFRYKGQSFQNFVTDEDLAAAHKDAVTTALSWFENQKNFQQIANNNTKNNNISEELIKSSFEKEYRWLAEVNIERFRKHVDSSFEDELEDGAFRLETSSFCYKKSAPEWFDIVPEQQIQSISEGIDKEIKSRVESFRKGIPWAAGGATNKNYVTATAATLSSNLEARGSVLKNKNKEFLATFATSYMKQVADEYNERISFFLANNSSNINVTELEETHQKWKGEALQKWESKILALDREYSSASQLVKLEGMLQEAFSCVWIERREALVEQILEEQRKRSVNEMIKSLQHAFGAGAVEAFRANLPATALPHSPYEGIFRAAVESIKIGQQRMGGGGIPLESNSATTTTTTSQTESTATQKNPSDDDGIVGKIGQAGGRTTVNLRILDPSQSGVYVVSKVIKLNSANSGRCFEQSSSAAPNPLLTKATQPKPKQARLENVPPTPTSTSKNDQPPSSTSSSSPSFDGGSKENGGRKRKSARMVGKEKEPCC